MKELGISHIFLRSELTRPELWWNRWYDFEMQYEAFSGGKGLVDGNRLLVDKAAAGKVFGFLGMFGDTIQLSEDLTAFNKKSPPYVVQITAPWDVSKYDAAGLKYGLDGDYVYGPPVVLKKGDIPYTFADAKGLVFYKGGKITAEMHKGAIAFIAWVYAKERNAQTDLAWLKTTGMLPMRGDTVDNPVFSAYIRDKKVLQDQAELVAHSVPAMANGAVSDILTALGEDGLCDYILTAAKNEPLSAPDAEPYVEKAVAGMKTAGSLR
jgi:multiple sugar transport system substrate-binding protein